MECNHQNSILILESPIIVATIKNNSTNSKIQNNNLFKCKDCNRLFFRE
jgi:hypothetical protein